MENIKRLEDGSIEIELEETETNTENQSEVTPEESKADTSEGQSETKGKYSGKTQEELIKILEDKEKFEGKLANELGNLRKTVNEIKSNPVFKNENEMTLEEVNSMLDAQRKKLSDLDTYDDDYDRKKSTIEKNIDNLTQSKYEIIAEEKIKQKYAKQNSETALSAFKAECPSMLDEESYNSIIETAQRLAGKGGVTVEDYHSAAMKVLGHTAYLKIFEVDAKEKLKKQLAGNTGMVTPSVSTSAPNPNRIVINEENIDKLTPEQRRSAIEKLMPRVANMLYRR